MSFSQKRAMLDAAARMYNRKRTVSRNGFKKFSGTPEEICLQIIKNNFDERTGFLVSGGHFREFYVRDFAFCAQALCQLGFEKEVRCTLSYVLAIFEKNQTIEQSISPKGVPYSFPTYAPDALALLLFTLQVTNNDDLVKKHHAFIQRQVDRFVKTVLDKKAPLPKTRRFSSIRDHAGRKGSCYDATMIAVVAFACEYFSFTFPYSKEQTKAAIIKHYWNGTYFFSDLQRQGIVVGDANVFPFWTGIITDKNMLKSAILSIRAAQLDNPFPLRYVNQLDKKHEKSRLHAANLFASDYETDSIWMHLGLCYLDLLEKELAAPHVEKIGELIEKYSTFLEVFSDDGSPFSRPFYVTDEGMLWCSKWLSLKKISNVKCQR